MVAKVSVHWEPSDISRPYPETSRQKSEVITSWFANQRIFPIDMYFNTKHASQHFAKWGYYTITVELFQVFLNLSSTFYIKPVASARFIRGCYMLFIFGKCDFCSTTTLYTYIRRFLFIISIIILISSFT